MNKKVLGVIFTITMGLTLAVVFASDIKASTDACVIGDTGYGTITEALATVTDSTETTIKLVDDIEENVVIDSGKVIILDLNGYVLKGNGSASVITNNGSLKIVDNNTNKPLHYYKVSSNGLWNWDDENRQGAISFSDALSNPSSVVENAIIAVPGGAITGGVASIHGGGIYNKNTIVINNISILGNTAITSDGSAYGGGVFNDIDDEDDPVYTNDPTQASAIIDCANICGNICYSESGINSNYGGGIYNNNTMSISGGSISFNIVKSSGTIYSNGCGGGIANDGKLNIEAKTIGNETNKVNIVNNKADSGGAIHNYFSGDITITRCDFENNEASKCGGAILNMDLGIANLSYNSFNSNSSNYEDMGGGAITSYSSLTISGDEFNNNYTKGFGGAVYSSDGNLTISGGKFDQNYAKKDGGAICVVSSTATIKKDSNLLGTMFINNTSEGCGGAIYSWDNSSKNVSISNAIFKYNKALADGGAINLDTGHINLDTCVITNNTAQNLGGGMTSWDTIIVAGYTVIKDNKKENQLLNASDSNLCLIDYQYSGTNYVTYIDCSDGLNTLSEGSSIYVTKYYWSGQDYPNNVCTIDGTFAKYGVGTYLNYFHSDDSKYRVEIENVSANNYNYKLITVTPITYHLNGGDNNSNNPVNINIGETPTLYSPTKSGYKFLGWYDNSGFTGDAITTLSYSATEIELYAKWQYIGFDDGSYKIVKTCVE